MSSFLWKGLQLEPAYGSARFLALLVELLLSCSAIYCGTAWGARALFGPHLPELLETYSYTCAVGFSGVLFGLKAVLMSGTSAWQHVSIPMFGPVQLPPKVRLKLSCSPPELRMKQSCVTRPKLRMKHYGSALTSSGGNGVLVRCPGGGTGLSDLVLVTHEALRAMLQAAPRDCAVPCRGRCAEDLPDPGNATEDGQLYAVRRLGGARDHSAGDAECLLRRPPLWHPRGCGPCSPESSALLHLSVTHAFAPPALLMRESLCLAVCGCTCALFCQWLLVCTAAVRSSCYAFLCEI